MGKAHNFRFRFLIPPFAINQWDNLMALIFHSLIGPASVNFMDFSFLLQQPG
jgi:hypothetical protein